MVCIDLCLKLGMLFAFSGLENANSGIMINLVRLVSKKYYTCVSNKEDKLQIWV